MKLSNIHSKLHYGKHEMLLRTTYTFFLGSLGPYYMVNLHFRSWELILTFYCAIRFKTVKKCLFNKKSIPENFA